MLTYHVIDSGADGPALLLLHGFTGSGENWRPFLGMWGERWRVLAVDLLGHGRSPSPPDPARYQMAHAAADLLALLDARGVERTHLLGYSMGGRLALYLAVHHPDRIASLVLESSSPGLPTAESRAERTARDNQLADFIERDGIEAFVARWETLALWESQKGLPTAVRQSLHEQRLQNNPVGLANSLRGMGTGRQPSLWPHLPTLSVPTLLIAGKLDRKFVAINQEMAPLLPDARLEIVPNAGHTVHLERPEAFSSAVSQFILDRET